MKYHLTFFLIFIFIGCNEIELENDVIISKEEREIMNHCESSEFNNIAEIRENIIGEWKLVGYACGYCIDHDAPYIEATFGVDSVEYFYDNRSEVETAKIPYHIENVFGRFIVQTTPGFYPLRTDVFCQNFMYSNHTALDGPMFLYKKVN